MATAFRLLSMYRVFRSNPRKQSEHFLCLFSISDFISWWLSIPSCIPFGVIFKEEVSFAIEKKIAKDSLLEKCLSLTSKDVSSQNMPFSLQFVRTANDRIDALPQAAVRFSYSGVNYFDGINNDKNHIKLLTVISQKIEN